MFTNTTWTSYIIFVALLLAAWYLVIGLRFYLSDLQILFSGKGKIIAQPALNEQPQPFRIPGKEETHYLFEEVQGLIVKIKEAVSDASAKNYNKEEFSFLLQLTLKEYPGLKGSPYQLPINNLIDSECEKQGFIRLSAEELEILWIEV